MFSAIVGQEKFKKAYLANIVNPKIGGLLVSGPKGTGKSTIVYSVEEILPGYAAVAGCFFNCDPHRPEQFCTLCQTRSPIKPTDRPMAIITLPISCTEDRLIGTIDIEKLLKQGVKEVIPGILGQANRNILYVDEVNLLPDHLVDDVLNAAALHWSKIEREGISITHPADFVLVGTMNPEEGDLRPQILDRFPLCVKIDSVKSAADRMEIIRRNLLYDYKPGEFIREFEPGNEEWRDRIVRARQQLPAVVMDSAHIRAIAESCAALNVDGQRPDIVAVKTACTLAALAGRREVNVEDITLAAELALVHRTRDGGLLEPATQQEIYETFTRYINQADHGARPAPVSPTGDEATGGQAGAGQYEIKPGSPKKKDSDVS